MLIISSSCSQFCVWVFCLFVFKVNDASDGGSVMSDCETTRIKKIE